jgi:hypothetical protein
METEGEVKESGKKKNNNKAKKVEKEEQGKIEVS